MSSEILGTVMTLLIHQLMDFVLKKREKKDKGIANVWRYRVGFWTFILFFLEFDFGREDDNIRGMLSVKRLCGILHRLVY
jgi:hypothetical protein